MKACTSTTSFTMMNNGGPSFFKTSRGLKQGVLFSPLCSSLLWKS